MKPLAKCLVDASSALPGAKRNTVLTTILLTSEDAELAGACIELFKRATARIDDDLVLGLHRACDRNGKLALARSSVLCGVAPPTFRKIFDEVYRRPDLTSAERNELLWTLEAFLFLNPRQIPRYERLVVGLLESPQIDLRVRALSMAGMLNRLDASALASLARGLRSRNPRLRVNALAGLYQMLERYDRLDPHLREFVGSPSFREQVARMRRFDPDDSVRHNAYAVLRVLGRAGSTRRARPRP